MPEGRPTDYNEDLTDKICAELAEGKSLNSITSSDAMPSIVSVYAWLRKYPEFLKKYERARGDQIDTFADELLDIADDSTNDYMDRKNKDGSEYEVLNGENIGRSRLRVDTRKWIAERMKPKKYGMNQNISLETKTGDSPEEIKKQLKKLEPQELVTLIEDIASGMV